MYIKIYSHHVASSSKVINFHILETHFLFIKNSPQTLLIIIICNTLKHIPQLITPRSLYLLIHMYKCKYKYDHDMSFHLMVMLRSTTGPYGRSVIEVVYGEIIFSLHRDCMGDDSSERVVGVSV